MMYTMAIKAKAAWSQSTGPPYCKRSDIALESTADAFEWPDVPSETGNSLETRRSIALDPTVESLYLARCHLTSWGFRERS